MLTECIKNSRKCWPLRRNLQVYINKLYYSQQGLDCYLSNIIENELENFIYVLNMFISIRTSTQKSPQFENVMFENPVRFSYLDTYLYLSLEETLNSIYELLHQKKVID